MRKNKMRSKWYYTLIGLAISTCIVAFLNYLWPSPWNLHSIECWIKTFLILCIYTGIHAGVTGSAMTSGEIRMEGRWIYTPFVVPAVVMLFFFVMLPTGAEIFHSKEYASIIQVEAVSSTDAILKESDTVSIALMDTASAKQLGDREIGSIANFSAFNVADDYIQLNVRGDAVKVAPLEYVGFFKWISNQDGGVTGYVSVSPTTMTADYVELKEGMQYVPSAYFEKDLYRHLHSQFPTLIIDNLHFEVDEEGNPYYVSSVFDKTIGLFGGEIVIGAIITNPVNGESTYYDISEIPQWVDYVIPGNLICELYNVAYKNANGFWNGTSFGANTGCMQTTTIDGEYDEDGEEMEPGTDFGYIAKDGDIYVYTGITSMAADSSNLGFIMVNERTGEYRYFAVSGANEQSAMNAAEGEVQQYGYRASFPTLINVEGTLSYIGVLKDQSGLVKLYYMVNVEDYGKVVVGNTREACVENYKKKLGIVTPVVPDATRVEFVVSVIRYVDIDGNTYVYLGTEDGRIFKALFSENEKLLFAQPGDKITGVLSNGHLTVD